MFFRREKPRIYAFAEQLDRLRQRGFQIEKAGSTTARVLRQGCAADIREVAEGQVTIGDVGVMVGGQMALLVELGFQKVWQTPDGKRLPALANHMRALHAFSEDLHEALGLKILYNESLGTVNEHHVYDRVVGRDRGVRQHPWDR